MTEIDDRDWVSAVIGEETYKTALETTAHSLLSDEPVDMGGKDLGPSPGDLLRMSLASCTAITLRMYANRKKIGVKKIEVRVNSKKLDDKTVFHMKIHIEGDLDESQRARMLQIGKACPIHKVLTGSIETEVQLI